MTYLAECNHRLWPPEVYDMNTYGGQKKVPYEVAGWVSLHPPYTISLNQLDHDSSFI